MSNENKTIHLYGLTWPTLIVGAILILTVAYGYFWIAQHALTAE